MHDLRLRDVVRRRAAQGDSLSRLARELGLPLSTVHRWARHRSWTDEVEPPRCWRCDDALAPAGQRAPYAYLLGQYLGDGHLVTSGRIPVLRIYGCADYPAMIEQIASSIRTIRGSEPGRVHPRSSARLVSLQSYWMHWPCLFPQHGPGRKHERPILLAPWQQEIVSEQPWSLIRGLIHSDGCRSLNRVLVRGKAYEYPRYFFANESADILTIMGAALDRVGVAWRLNRPNSISVARRDAVALMDQHVGPKR